LGERERDRAAAICLSHHGWYVEKIAAYLRIGIETVRRTLNKWKKEGLGGIYEKKDVEEVKNGKKRTCNI
jgi:transposase